jgi:hypothetical protein
MTYALFPVYNILDMHESTAYCSMLWLCTRQVKNILEFFNVYFSIITAKLIILEKHTLVQNTQNDSENYA